MRADAGRSGRRGAARRAVVGRARVYQAAISPYARCFARERDRRAAALPLRAGPPAPHDHSFSPSQLQAARRAGEGREGRQLGWRHRRSCSPRRHHPDPLERHDLRPAWGARARARVCACASRASLPRVPRACSPATATGLRDAPGRRHSTTASTPSRSRATRSTRRPRPCCASTRRSICLTLTRRPATCARRPAGGAPGARSGRAHAGVGVGGRVPRARTSPRALPRRRARSRARAGKPE